VPEASVSAVVLPRWSELKYRTVPFLSIWSIGRGTGDVGGGAVFDDQRKGAGSVVDLVGVDAADVLVLA
jgi:hypothetical protein